MRQGILRIILVVAALLPGARAWAQVDSREGIALENEILELRQQVQQMQGQMQGLQQLQVQAAPQALPPPVPEGENPAASQAGGGSGDVVAQLLVRVGNLEEEVRNLQGKVDELSNTQQHDHDDLTKQIGDLAFKVTGGASPQGAPPPGPGAPQGMEAVPGDLTPTPTPKPPPPAPARRTPEQSLKLGQAALARRDYDAASAAAQDVLAAGKGPRTADAQILLAHAAAGKHDYKAAAAAYYAVYKGSPRSVRGAESLLGVANSLLGMGDKPHACQALAKFGAEFPRPEAPLRASAASMRKRAGC